MNVPSRFRGLFRKYFLALFLAAAVPLALNGLIEAWFGYRDQRARLDELLGVQATAAAAEINGFVDTITNELGWLVQLPWSDQADERRRTEAFRLFRQAPAITSIALLDDRLRERLYVSRIGMNRVDSRVDRSSDPAALGARSDGRWFGNVTYNRGSEPFMAIAVAGNRPSVGVVVADVNLKLIWDVVSAIKVGKTGFAFVLDRTGQLIAHPDISLVLRGADQETSKPFKAMAEAIGRVRVGFATARDAQGRDVAAAAASIAGPDWLVVVAQPFSEAFGPIYRALWRTLGFLLVGAVGSGLLAYTLASRMIEPIRLLEEGTRRIGAGSLEHRITIETGDELERLADSFNKMASELTLAQQHRERIARLKRFLAPQVADLVDRAGNDSVLEGRRTEVVVLFCDLRGFTSFSADAGPDHVMTVLSEYYEALGREITRFSATLISFSGDGLMVLVNAPVAVEQPALIALDLAVEMQRCVQRLVIDWRARGYGLGFGVGLASGPATVGRIGYENRFDYTAIGNVVNLAARLCASATDREILTDAEVAKLVGDRRPLKEMGHRSIKGFDEAIAVFGLSIEDFPNPDVVG
jgi:class 3 adenylate cyclase